MSKDRGIGCDVRKYNLVVVPDKGSGATNALDLDVKDTTERVEKYSADV